MPNFAYTNTTQFRPFSFEEQLRPLLMYTQAHQAVEEAYSELDSQANAIGSLANEANDPVTYQRYKAYESALRTQADALAKNGLTPSSRQSLLDLKGRYAKDITPIQNAITRRRELADEQRKALLQNPTLMFQRDMNSMSYDSSLDRFLENPDYDYGERYSGALLTQQVSQAAGNLAKELSNYGNGKRLDAYTKTFLQKHGFTRDQVLDAINNPNRAQSQPVLNAIVEQVMGSSGMASWADQPTMDKAYNYARQGLWSAIGQTNISTYEDYGARLAAKEAMQKRVKAYNPSSTEEPTIKGLALNPRSIYSARMKTDAEKAFNNNIKNFSQYFYRDSRGRIRLNYNGVKEYRRNATPTVTETGSGSGTAALANAETKMQKQTKFTPTAFKKFLDSIGGSMRMEKSAGYNSGRIGDLWKKYLNNPVSTTAGYDTTKYTEYYYDIDPSERDVWKGNLLKTAVNGQLTEVDFDSKSKKYKSTGKTLSVEDLNKTGYEVLGVAVSRFGDNNRGNIVEIKDDSGHVKKYKLNPGINEANENAVMEYINYASLLESIPKEGGFIMGPNNKPVFVTREQAEEEHSKALQAAQLHLSQLGLTNKTKSQEFNPYGF